MGLFGFGKKTLDSISVKEIRKSKQDADLRQQVLLQKMKKLSDQKQMNFEAAKGKTDTEKLLAAYQDEQLATRIQDAEREIQLLLTRTRMFDGAMLVKEKQKELEKSGAWKKLLDLEEDSLEAELDTIMRGEMDTAQRVEMITDRLTIGTMKVETSRTPGMLEFLKKVEEAETS